jgi:(4S)-4-hydroxy-5-phosphonooxypentane-2,3-dione isomerase
LADFNGRGSEFPRPCSFQGTGLKAQAAGPFNFATSQDREIAGFSYHPLMLILQVNVRVKPEQVEAFREATAANSKGSLTEPGIARFDVLQNEEDPTRFMLVEAYRHREAVAAHKETSHYLAWVEAVTPMMAEPRTRSWWTSVHPDDAAW